MLTEKDVRHNSNEQIIHVIIAIAIAATLSQVMGYLYKHGRDYSDFAISISIIVSIVSITTALYCLKFYRDSKAKNIALSVVVKNYAPWDEIEKYTGLLEFKKTLEDSAFLPAKILKEGNIQSLKIMGNGCSKWTSSDRHDFTKALENTRKARGKILFLIQDPITINASNRSNDSDIAQRAKSNAKSLIVLREFARKFKDTVEYKTYKHSAELRITLYNNHLAALGNYAGSHNTDSRYSPILVFKNDHQNMWSFYRAWEKYFDSEWHASSQINESDWTEIENISKMEL